MAIAGFKGEQGTSYSIDIQLPSEASDSGPEDGYIQLRRHQPLDVRSEVARDTGSAQTQYLTDDIEFPKSPDLGDGPVLRWAGDLDGDGALDLLLDHTYLHYNVFRSMQLHLSSHTTDGALVGYAAGLYGYEC